MGDDLKQIREVENRIKAIYARIGKEVPAKLLDNKSVEDANKSLSVARTLLSDLESSASNLYDQLKGITSEFKGQRTSINESRSSLRKLTDISRELKLNEEGVNQLSSQQIKNLTRRYNVQSSIFSESQQARTDEILGREYIKEQLDAVTKGEKDKNAATLEYLSILEGISDEERALLYLRFAQEKPLEKIGERLKEAAEFENKITSAIGLTGAAFENLNKIGIRAFGGLGINLGTLQEGFESANEAMRAQAISDMDSNLSSFQKRTNALKAGLKALGPVLIDTFTDPLILAKGLADAFFDINKASVDLRRETGQGLGAFDGLNARTATTVDLMETVVEFTKQTGLNTQNIFSPEVLAGAAEFKNLMGGTAEESAGLLDLTAATGMTTDAILESTVETVNAFNSTNRAAISQRGVMRDVLSASTAVKASLAGNPKALAEAASAARRLGLSLQEVDSIADSLLDFESSINSELEAQLLTGRDINLNKARELALNNDLAGVSNEIFKNQVSVAEFSRMNRIQQDGLAKALGLNRDQLANMAFQQARLNGLTDEAAAAAAGVSLEDMQRMEIQQNLQKILQKTLQIFEPLINILTDFLSRPWVAKIAVWGVIAAKAFMPITRYLGDATRGVTKFFSALKPKNLAETGKKIKDTVVSAFQGTDKVSDTAKGVKKLTDASKGMPPNRRAGMGLRFFFTNLGKGLGAFGKGAAPAIPVLLSIAAVAAGIGAAFAGLGFGINQAAEGIVNLTHSLTLDKVKTLYAAAGAIGALSASLGAFALTGVLALPALLAVTPLLTGLNAAGDAGEAEGQNTMAKVEEKLDLLIQTIDKKRTIVINGKELEEVMVMR